MSFEVIGLGKLLSAMYADKSQRISILRDDIRRQIAKDGGFKGKGGDFYVSFWADAKNHVSGNLDLRASTPERIKKHSGRRRLYPLLMKGFLLWWEEKRRLRNVDFTVIDDNVKARFDVASLGTIKVENTLSITVGDDGHRIIYPYFCEDPALSEEAARLGLWVMSQCIKGYALKDMRVFDVIAGRTFSQIDTPLQGDEEETLQNKYGAILSEWHALRTEYA